jgi:HEPN domain-containing protein
MAHTAESYREAALEQVQVARDLHDAEQEYGAAHYFAGVAVECMLRAYRMRLDPQFDSRHDLASLVRSARFYDAVPPSLAPDVAAAVQEVATRWSNDHRYRPKRLVARWLRDGGLDQRVQGDRLKYSSARIVDAAEQIVAIGEQRWRSRTR